MAPRKDIEQALAHYQQQASIATALRCRRELLAILEGYRLGENEYPTYSQLIEIAKID